MGEGEENEKKENMSFHEIYDQSVKEGLMKRIADDILQGITKVREQPGISSRRWLWELLQNARDVPNSFDGISIKIILDKDYIKICHNGNPFSLKNLNNLIMQVSSKSENDKEDSVGKFGTGFLVTHLLSKKLNLSGILKLEDNDHYQFKIEIDRSAENSIDLQKSIETLLNLNRDLDKYDNFKKVNIYQPVESNYDTIFAFPLDDKSLIYATNGIKDLVNTLPLTMVFSTKIKNVHIENNIDNKKYSFTRSRFTNENVKAINTNNGTEYFWLKKSSNTSVALRVKDFNDYTPIDWDDNTPKLYRDFPLIGSENFYSAFVIHSSLFSPDEKRSGLLLTDQTNVKVDFNRELLIEAYKLINEFIVEIGVKPENYLLAESRIPAILRDEEETKLWFVESVQIPYRKFLLENLRFVNAKNEEAVLQNMQIPFLENANVKEQEDFYDVIEGFYDLDNLPSKKDFRNWLNRIKSDYKKWEKHLLVTVDDLTTKIVNKNTFSAFQNLSDVQLVNSFNNYFKFLNVSGNANIIQTKRVIPNASGQLTLLQDLFINDNIQEVFLDIINLERPNYRALFLIHKDVKIQLNHQKKSSNDILKEIIDIIKIENYGIDDDEQLKVIYSLLRLQYNDNPNFRSKVFSVFCKIFQFKEEILLIKSEDNNFNFEYVVKTALAIMLNKISSFQTIENLGENLELEQDDPIAWLNSLLKIIKENTTHQEILNNYKVFPNLYGEFMLVNRLFKVEGGYTESVLNLITFHDNLLQNSELKMILIHDQCDLEINQIKTVGEICAEIDNQVKATYMMDWNEIAVEKRNKIFELLEWSLHDKNKVLINTYFTWLPQNRASILMEQMGSSELKDTIFTFMRSDEDIIVAVGEILKNKSVEQLQNFMNTDSDTFDRIHGMIADLENKDVAKVEKFIEEQKEERRDFNFKKQIGNTFEKLFKEFFESQNLPFVVHKMESPADFKIINGEHFYYVELKSIAENTDPKKVTMSYNQAFGATTFKDNYALCVLERPVDWQRILNANEGVNFISKKTKVVKNIGNCLEKGFQKSKDFKKTLLEGVIDGVGVEFKDNDFKITVQSVIWNQATSLDDLFTEIKNKLLK